MAHQTTMPRYTTGIFSTTSMKIASHVECTDPVYATIFHRSPSKGVQVLYTNLIHDPLGCPELLTPQITDAASLDSSKPS
jgi:hypothetical protein